MAKYTNIIVSCTTYRLSNIISVTISNFINQKISLSIFERNTNANDIGLVVEETRIEKFKKSPFFTNSLFIIDYEPTIECTNYINIFNIYRFYHIYSNINYLITYLNSTTNQLFNLLNKYFHITNNGLEKALKNNLEYAKIEFDSYNKNNEYIDNKFKISGIQPVKLKHYNISKYDTVKDFCIDNEIKFCNEISNIKILNHKSSPYRLADIYKGMKNSLTALVDIPNYNKLVGGEYYDYCCYNDIINDDKKFIRIVESHAKNNSYISPDDDELVVSLRISDKPSSVKNSIDILINKINDIVANNNLNKITIVVGLHYPNKKTTNKQSLLDDVHALNKLQNGIQNVNFLSSTDVDADFYYLFKSKWLLVTESGFGALAASLSSAIIFDLTEKIHTKYLLNNKWFDYFNARNKNIPLDNSNTVIIISTRPKTGSTLLANILQGLVDDSKPITYIEPGSYPANKELFDKYLNNKISVVKTHYGPGKFAKTFSSYRTIFVFINRTNVGDAFIINSELENITFDYDDIIETDNRSYADVINNIANEFKKFNLYFNKTEITRTIKRISNMNDKIEELKNNDFKTCVNFFYHVHGSHRNRPKYNISIIRLPFDCFNIEYKNPDKSFKNIRRVAFILPPEYRFQLMHNYIIKNKIIAKWPESIEDAIIYLKNNKDNLFKQYTFLNTQKYHLENCNKNILMLIDGSTNSITEKIKSFFNKEIHIEYIKYLNINNKYNNILKYDIYKEDSIIYNRIAVSDGIGANIINGRNN